MIVDILIMTVTGVKLYRDANEVSALKICDGLSRILWRDGMFNNTAIFVLTHMILVQA